MDDGKQPSARPSTDTESSESPNGEWVSVPATEQSEFDRKYELKMAARRFVRIRETFKRVSKEYDEAMFDLQEKLAGRQPCVVEVDAQSYLIAPAEDGDLAISPIDAL